MAQYDHVAHTSFPFVGCKHSTPESVKPQPGQTPGPSPPCVAWPCCPSGGPASACHLPLCPPLLDSSRTSEMVMSLLLQATGLDSSNCFEARVGLCAEMGQKSKAAAVEAPSAHAALHISYTVSAATVAAVRASISTPVAAVHVAVASMSRACASGRSRRLTATCDSATGWQSGMSSDVRFAAMMPARRAVTSTLPLALVLAVSAEKAAGPRWTEEAATAVLVVSALAETSTIDASPWLST
mmetsp:Transcript_63347/g.125237  ORF Transcript_63347/g.125237 Transcript_63347/m.125237 type:complete len:241 (-) Transcript_63347:140-862(-)